MMFSSMLLLGHADQRTYSQGNDAMAGTHQQARDIGGVADHPTRAVIEACGCC